MPRFIKALEVCLLTLALLAVSACGKQASSGGIVHSQKNEESATTSEDKDSSDSNSIADDSPDNNSTDSDSSSSDSVNSDSSSDDSSDSNSSSGDSSSNSSSDLINERCDKVLNATLKLLSTDGYTTVDFANKTASRDGKKMTLDIISAAEEGQTEFQKGSIAEAIDDGNGWSHDNTIYLFEFDDNEKLSLIEPLTSKVVYTEE